ncbi:MAG: hypothetical protein IPM97_10550 [Bdellovibrionaceae bacterium]|nr:hypothetical protein [Pseudobdellovibrionaceae bacterium]
MSNRKYAQKRIYASIKKDVVNPRDYLKYDIRSACEDCSHFASETTCCTLGYNVAPHLKAQQKHDMELSGRMAQCRFHEID